VIVDVRSDVDSVKICVNNDTTRWYNTPTLINVERSRNDLKITARKDTIQKQINVKSKLSTAFWVGNIFSGTGILGYAIDLTNPKDLHIQPILQLILNPIIFQTENIEHG
jgi:hypothetical protein